MQTALLIVIGVLAVAAITAVIDTVLFRLSSNDIIRDRLQHLIWLCARLDDKIYKLEKRIEKLEEENHAER